MALAKMVTAMITPFDDRGEVALDEAGRIAHWLVERGNDGLVVAGTTGEGPTLSAQERNDLIRAVKSAVGERACVIANTGTNDTRASVTATQGAQAAGADAILAVVPFYNKPPQDGMLLHFGEIAKATSLPIVIYNIPGRTAANMLPETLLELAARHRNISGVKESTGDIAQFSDVLRNRPAGFTFLCGDDHMFLASLALGADGIVGVATHVCSREFLQMMELHAQGRIAEAAQIHFDLVPLYKALFATSNPIGIKWAMRQFGFRTGECRLPLSAFPSELQNRLMPLLERFKQKAAV